MAKTPPLLKREKRYKTIFLIMRVHPSEKRFLQELADHYTDGNLSRWMLEAAKCYAPPNKPDPRLEPIGSDDDGLGF